MVTRDTPSPTLEVTSSMKSRRSAAPKEAWGNGFLSMNLDAKFLADFGKSKTIQNFDGSIAVFSQGE